ncbi:TetR/AcrR family transcriptional regulator [Streptacidiphilus carbonis]|uniref:TetR/AcrR family transcriptional regulator n=1 Tax=Streptacidiphilus carbonis TaxID=105422 RepID=UPI0005A81E6A|nr:TetR/AcrR family transcriptional regulator [Streptacidiphilus carbonis]
MDPTPTAAPRGRNPRGKGERLREDIVESALALLDELGDDQALSLRAVARRTNIAATSVYIHFADRNALVLAAMERCHHELVRAVDETERDSEDPVDRLRARTLLLGAWAQEHPGLYRVLHESTVNQSPGMPFRQELADRSTLAVQRCMDAGLAPVDDPALIALDLRAAVHGAVSMRLSQPDLPWPSLEDQVDRFLTRLVGVRLR